MKKVYAIEINGHRTEYDTLESAMEEAWRRARVQAEFEERDPDDLDDWGDSDESGYGVCPSDNDGAYWPQVTVEDERGRTPHHAYYMIEE